MSILSLLSIAEGPSRIFKPYINIPGGRTQFGSLIVYLPTKFKGAINAIYPLHKLLTKARRPTPSRARGKGASLRL